MFAFPRAAALLAASLLLAEPASAQIIPQAEGKVPQPSLKWTRTTGLISDYRDRGLSYSDLEPAAQAGLNVEHSSGLYAFADASTVRFGRERDMEIGVGAGWIASLGDAGSIDISASYVGYVDFAAVDYMEATIGWRLPLGSVTPFAAVDYVPGQKPIRGEGGKLASNLYLHGGAEWNLVGTPLTMRAELGRERGSFVASGTTKWDWQLGATAKVRGLDLGVTYVDTDASRFDPELRRLTRRGLILTASKGF